MFLDTSSLETVSGDCVVIQRCFNVPSDLWCPSTTLATVLSSHYPSYRSTPNLINLLVYRVAIPSGSWFAAVTKRNSHIPVANMSASAIPQNLDLRCRVPPSATLAINELSHKLIKEGRKVHKLGLGQSPFPVPPFMVQALQENATEKSYLPVQGFPPNLTPGRTNTVYRTINLCFVWTFSISTRRSNRAQTKCRVCNRFRTASRGGCWAVVKTTKRASNQRWHHDRPR